MPTLTIVDSSDPSGSSTFSLTLSGTVPKLRVETLLDFVKTELAGVLHTKTVVDDAILEFNGHRLLSGHRCGEYGIQDGSVIVLSNHGNSVAPVMIETLSGSSSPVPPGRRSPTPRKEDEEKRMSTSCTKAEKPVEPEDDSTVTGNISRLTEKPLEVTRVQEERSSTGPSTNNSNPPPSPCRPPPIAFVESSPPPVRAPSPAIPRRMASTASLVESRSSPIVVPTRHTGTTPDSIHGSPPAIAVASRDSPTCSGGSRVVAADGAAVWRYAASPGDVLSESPSRLPLDVGIRGGDTPPLAPSPSLSFAGSCSTPSSLPPARLSRRASMKSSPPHHLNSNSAVERAAQSPIIPPKKGPSSPHSGGALPILFAPPPTDDGNENVHVIAAHPRLVVPMAELSHPANSTDLPNSTKLKTEEEDKEVGRRPPMVASPLAATSPSRGSIVTPTRIGDPAAGPLESLCPPPPPSQVGLKERAESTTPIEAHRATTTISDSRYVVEPVAGVGDAEVSHTVQAPRTASGDADNPAPAAVQGVDLPSNEAAQNAGATVRDIVTAAAAAEVADKSNPTGTQSDVPPRTPEDDPDALPIRTTPRSVVPQPLSHCGDSHRSTPHTPLSARSTPARNTPPFPVPARNAPPPPVEACTQTSHRSTPLGAPSVMSPSMDQPVVPTRAGIGVSQSAADIIARLTARARAHSTDKVTPVQAAAPSTPDPSNPATAPQPLGGPTPGVTRRLRVVTPGASAVSPSRPAASTRSPALGKPSPQASSSSSTSVRAALSLVRAAAMPGSPRPGAATSRSPAARASAPIPLAAGKKQHPAPNAATAAAPADSRTALVRYRELLKQQQRGGTKRHGSAAATANQAAIPVPEPTGPSPREVAVAALRTRLADLELLGRAYHQLQELRLQTTMVRGELAVMSNAVAEVSDAGARIRARRVHEENLRAQLREALQLKRDHEASTANFFAVLKHITELCAGATAPLATIETQLQRRHEMRSSSAPGCPTSALPLALLLAVDHEDDLLRTEEERQRQSFAEVVHAYHESCRLEDAIHAELHDHVERECLLSVRECDAVKRLQAAHEHQMDFLVRQKRQLACRIRDDAVTLRRKGALATAACALHDDHVSPSWPVVTEVADAEVAHEAEGCHSPDEGPVEAASEVVPQPIPLFGGYSYDAASDAHLATVQQAAGQFREQYHRLVDRQRHATVKFLEHRQSLELQLLETRNLLKDVHRRNQALLAHQTYLEQRACGMDPERVHLPEILADRREAEPETADTAGRDGPIPPVRKRFLSSFRPAGATQGPTISSMVRDEVTAEVLLTRAQNVSTHPFT